MKRNLRRRRAIRPWVDDEECVYFLQEALSHFPERPVRKRHRHSREQIRMAREKALLRARRLISNTFWMANDDDEDWKERMAHRFSTDRKPCSCDRCGHRRKWEGPPVSEQRVADRERFDDWDSSEEGERRWAAYWTVQGKIAGLDEPDPEDWIDHPSYVDPMRDVPECGMADVGDLDNI